MVAFGSGAGGASWTRGVPSSRQKFSEASVYVRLQLGQRFIVKRKLDVRWALACRYHPLPVLLRLNLTKLTTN